MGPSLRAGLSCRDESRRITGFRPSEVSVNSSGISLVQKTTMSAAGR